MAEVRLAPALTASAWMARAEKLMRAACEVDQRRGALGFEPAARTAITPLSLRTRTGSA